MTKFDELSNSYQNTPEWHGQAFDDLYQYVQNTPYLKAHRDFVEQSSWGMNDRPHHGSWEAIIETMPSEFNALEVGVYRGQVVSLIGLIAKHFGKTANITGVGLYAGMADGVNAYDRTLNYERDVKTIFDQFNAGYDRFIAIKGWSQDRAAVEATAQRAPFDVMYIDGGHDYTAVRLDINNYAPMLKVGGILVMDDSAFFLNMPEFSQDRGYNRCWRGEKVVSLAVQDWLDTRDDFKHCFAIGHNRIYRKVK